MSYRKAQPDMYTVLLVIALLAIIVGIVFMYLELSFYDFKSKGGPAVTINLRVHETISEPVSPTTLIARDGSHPVLPARFFASLRMSNMATALS